MTSGWRRRARPSVVRGGANMTVLNIRRWTRLLSAGFATFTLLFGLHAHAGEIRLFAAASLTDALTTLSTQYQASHPAITIKTSFAASSVLARQIENGAPAQIFLSADKDWADYLEQRGLLLPASRQDLLGNQLVLIAPAGREIIVTPDATFNLAGAFSGRFCTGDVASVPVGKYTKQAFTHLGWWDAIAPRLANTEDVSAALAFVAPRECAPG